MDIEGGVNADSQARGLAAGGWYSLYGDPITSREARRG